MPTVRMLTDVAGPDAVWHAGEDIEMTPEQAGVWADGVRGELVRPVAVVDTPEATSRRRGAGYVTPEGRSTR